MNNSKFQYWIFIFIAFIYFLILYHFFGVTLGKVKALPANELGDFLAGTFSPLAFIFLILGYLQNNRNIEQNTGAITQQAIALQQQAESLKMQAQELQISNQALQAQAIELRNSVQQQMEQVRISNEQLEYYRSKDLSDSEKEILQVRPRLQLNRNGSSTSGDRFILSNFGEEALDIKCNRPVFNTPYLAKGKSCNIEANICAEFLEFQYKDKLGNQYKTRFEKGRDHLGMYDLKSSEII